MSSTRMRIVHAASNIGGLPVLLAERQRRLGCQAAAVLYPTTAGAAPGSVDLAQLLQGNRITRRLRRARVIAWVARTFDVFHFHFHTTFAPTHEDVALLAALGKRIIFHLHGCDIRDPRRARVEHALSACSECTIPCMVPVKLRLPDTIRRHADAVLVSTPDLLEFVPHAEYLPNPIDPTPWERLRRPTVHSLHPGQEWVVAHAPSNREIKGTRHVIAAIEQLRAEGLPVRLRLIEGLSGDELRAAYAGADVVVDQLFAGWVGLVALEMMAMGKPVIAYIRPDLRHLLHEMPVVDADPRSLADTLRDLLLDPDRRAEVGARGPGYVRAHHDPDVACRRLLEIYRRAPERRLAR
jgi:glycosyltransferase involved in cell wall biosynthesis